MRTKPYWLDKKINLEDCRRLKTTLKDLKLNTVCEASLCPNISECFSSRVATFIILGNICTRGCSFCKLTPGVPAKFDPEEPKRIKQAVKRLGLNHVVVTSPTRDDLADKGLEAYCRTTEEILSLGADKIVELLVPDFSGDQDLLGKLATCQAKIIGHNIETVPSLYIEVRKGSDYQRSLEVLRRLKKANKDILTKSGLMLGLGEKSSEVLEVIEDLSRVGCDFLTLGQYLPPSLAHFPLKSYISPDKFLYFKEFALKLGFKSVSSTPYTRSSYLAHSFLHNM